MTGRKSILKRLVRTFANTSTCGVKGCEKSHEVQIIELKRFDPIDHDSTFAPLCGEHQAWADQRNKFAERMADELREARKEIGQEHIEQIQALAVPQGSMKEDVLMGKDQGRIPLSEALDDQEIELREKSDVRGLLTGGD